MVAISPDLRNMLTERWTRLKPHGEQQRLWHSKARFRVVPAGRRSGKTEVAKRFTVKEAIRFAGASDGWFVMGAPVHAQARRIYWEPMKKMVPEWMISKIIETDMTIRLVTGTEITVLGMDTPERIEGRPLDGIVLDEYADMKPIVWTKHVRAALSTIGRPGWAWFIGTPEGRNHYYDLYCEASADESGEWETFTWKSAEILDPSEIASARRDLDPMTFAQEYEASFLNFEGRVYYGFDRKIHAKERMQYNPNLPLVFCFDFNVKPGVAVVSQEQFYKGGIKGVDKTKPITAVLGEVYIPENSNTPMVCRKLVYDWGFHQGDVLCYGDATGGSKGSAKVAGSDWELIRKVLTPEFEERVKFRYRKRNPKERARVNAVNSRFMSADGAVRCLVDPIKAPKLIKDFEGVTYIEGGAGEIDKLSNPQLTHSSDAFGYFVEKRYPVDGAKEASSKEV